MKRSTVYLLSLVLSYFIVLMATNMSLVKSYHQVQLNDPYKNYDELPIAAFSSLHVKGGNSFAIRICAGTSFTMKVMKSRREFLKYVQNQDSLVLNFSVPHTQTMNVPTGIIITCPGFDSLMIEGSRVMLDSLVTSELVIEQKGRAGVEIQNSNVERLLFKTYDESWVRFNHRNTGEFLSIDASNRSRINIQEISYHKIETSMKDSSLLILSAASVQKFRR